MVEGPWDQQRKPELPAAEPGMYKGPYPPWKFIKSVGEEYQVVKRKREYHGCGEEYNMEKGKGEAKSFSLKYWGSWEEYQMGKRWWEQEFLGRKQDFKKIGWGRISSFYTPQQSSSYSFSQQQTVMSSSSSSNSRTNHHQAIQSEQRQQIREDANKKNDRCIRVMCSNFGHPALTSSFQVYALYM